MANVWRDAVPSSTVSSGTQASVCDHYFIPAGTLVFYDAVEQQTISVVIESSGAYVPNCDAATVDNSVGVGTLVGKEANGEEIEPFYGSVIPIAYTISATTIIAWLLFILLLIAQKKRPWFQKFMTLFVAISLTVFLARTTKFLEYQYRRGYHDAEELRHHVFGSLSFRILEVLSILIVWMAHLQVLLRMFDRAKERQVILWAGVVLAVIDTTFWCLVNFLVPYHTDNHTLRDVIPALADLFQITIQIVYAGAVIIYAIRKRKFAFNRKSIITAIISLCAVLMPLIFFILDLAEYWITGWSEFIRWVSDAAASVVVWEWIDAVERLEKEQQKNGVLGRQIYEDDDDMAFGDINNNVGKSSRSSDNTSGTGGAGNTGAGDGGTASGATNEVPVVDQTISKRYNRSFIPSFFRPGNGSRWVVSRASSTASVSTSYGTEIHLNMLGSPHQAHPSDNDNASPANNLASFYTSSPIHHPQALPPTPEAAVLPQSETPALSTPIPRETPSSSPKPTPPPLVKHLHPLRRSSKRSRLPGTITTSTPTNSEPPLSSTSVGHPPISAQSQLPTPSSPARTTRHPSGLTVNASHDSEQDEENEDEEDEETYTIVRSEGFDLQPPTPLRQFNEPPDMPPPSFEPHPGFHVEDYWDEKHPPTS